MKAVNEGMLLIGALVAGLIVAGPPQKAAQSLTFAAPATPTIRVVLRSPGGGVLSCPASSINYDSGTAEHPRDITLVEVEGFTCPLDFIFRNGFEVKP